MFRRQWIESYIKKDSARKGGFFTIFDPDAGVAVPLDYERVNQVLDLGNGTHVACVGMSTPEGRKYDLDFFIRGDTPHDLNITRIMIHSDAEQSRYEWYQEGAHWKRRSYPF